MHGMSSTKWVHLTRSIIALFIPAFSPGCAVHGSPPCNDYLLVRSLVTPHTSPSPSSPPLKGGGISHPSPHPHAVTRGEGEGAVLMNSLVSSALNQEMLRAVVQRRDRAGDPSCTDMSRQNRYIGLWAMVWCPFVLRRGTSEVPVVRAGCCLTEALGEKLTRVTIDEQSEFGSGGKHL